SPSSSGLVSCAWAGSAAAISQTRTTSASALRTADHRRVDAQFAAGGRHMIEPFLRHVLGHRTLLLADRLGQQRTRRVPTLARPAQLVGSGQVGAGIDRLDTELEPAVDRAGPCLRLDKTLAPLR